MAPEYPDYPRYRTLQLTEPRQRGQDVRALQIAINYLKVDLLDLTVDGVLGPDTARAILDSQERFGIVVDGKAGGQTQERLANYIAVAARRAHRVAVGALYGQLAHESGFRLGNYSPLRDDGSFDAGVAQRNTALHNVDDAFDPVSSIDLLADAVRGYYDRFAGVGPDRRRWQLAQGGWNAPAFAGFLANEEGGRVPRRETARPSPAARATFEGYMASVSSYLRV